MQIPITLFNTLTGRKEDFKSLNVGQVTMYNCGPTVYNHAHIGNLRAYVFADVLRRVFEYNGYKVKQVVNITDVGHLTSDADDGDDKMSRALEREGKPKTIEAMREVAEFYAESFVQDLKDLNIELPHELPRATDHIAEDIEIIKILEEKGFAYKTSDGLYYDISKYPDYGKLGNIKLGGLLPGARIDINTEKRGASDFALWKFSTTGIGWESPWGKGFPGWHIECSAMSRRYLGQPFDVHTGGIDHIPVHHNNEIAQSEAAFGVPLANYWLHNEHLNLSGEKIAKSTGNALYLKDLVTKGISPLAYRYFILLAGYRTPVTFHEEVVAKTAVTSLQRVYRELSELPEGGTVSSVYKEEFLSAVNNDLNTALGISVVYKVLNDGALSPEDKLATLLDFDRVLGFKFAQGRADVLAQKNITVPNDVRALLDLREKARTQKDWKHADIIRDQIREKGFEVKDGEQGQEVKLL